jgi:hypothetical protein
VQMDRPSDEEETREKQANDRAENQGSER